MATKTFHGLNHLKTRKFYAALLAEFLGTLLLVLVSCGAWPKDVAMKRDYHVIDISFAFGLSMATIVWIIGHISGGHINPAVTLAFLVTRRISIIRGILYVPVQMLGALVGAGILRGLTPDAFIDKLDVNMGVSRPRGDVTEAQTFGVEFMITFVLVFAFFSTVDRQRKDLRGSGPLSIGLAVVMCHLWAVPYTGAGMNPARVFGPAVISGMWHAHWAYWVGPIVGGAVAGWLYEFFFAVNATPAKLRGFFSTVNYDQDRYDQYGRKSADDTAAEMKEKEDVA